MTAWSTTEGTGWVDLPGIGAINPCRDNVDGGRHYFTAQTAGAGFAEARGPHISDGPETWSYELDQPFHLRDVVKGTVLEVVISLLPGGRYAVKSRAGDWPVDSPAGGWA